jgi:NAD(P)H-quinone oxidoreductase subunit 5
MLNNEFYETVHRGHSREIELRSARYRMLAPLSDPTAVPAWQALLAMLPAIAAAIAAWAIRPATAEDRAWTIARRASAVALGAAAASLLALIAGHAGSAYGIRVDIVGGVVALLVAFIAWVIVRYSQPYLAADARAAYYARWLMVTIAAVMTIVCSNHLLVLALAWIVTSLALHRLLTFFNDRPAAVIAAHKKFVVARAADLCMLAAVALLAAAFGTLQIDRLLADAAAQPEVPATAQAAMVLIALAALLKCAQLPFHGWLIQVMEAPTPVSALLHAGVVNLGGFVLIRLAPLLAEVPAAQVLLVAGGAFTAVVAALVMTTRISIKVMLAWSTCAQMGFMLMQVGLGLPEMALLHLVAHSLYKAHAFLNAGSTVQQASVRKLGPATSPASTAVQIGGALVGLVMTAVAAALWGIDPQAEPAVWVLGGIVALALTPMAQVAGGARGLAGTVAGAAAAFAIACVYFALHALVSGAVYPGLAPAAALLWISVAIAFVLLFALQCIVTSQPHGRIAVALYPWFYGGLFLDERFSRLLFRRWPPPAVATAHTPSLEPIASGAAR